MPTVVDLIQKSDRFNREDIYDFNLMIIGIPNVGKSTIINKMRHMYLRVGGKATITGALPGVTRSVLERIKINANPPVYLFDTPGVLEPKIDKSLEVTMRCALCGQSLNRNFFFQSYCLLVKFF
jgi:ribosome biogenesis GTPase A